jgi:hypothetical protein
MAFSGLNGVMTNGIISSHLTNINECIRLVTLEQRLRIFDRQTFNYCLGHFLPGKHSTDDA